MGAKSSRSGISLMVTFPCVSCVCTWKNDPHNMIVGSRPPSDLPAVFTLYICAFNWRDFRQLAQPRCSHSQSPERGSWDHVSNTHRLEHSSTRVRIAVESSAAPRTAKIPHIAPHPRRPSVPPTTHSSIRSKRTPS